MPLTDDEIKALLEGTKGVTVGPWTVEMHGPSPVLYSGRSNERHGWNLLRLSDGDWNFNNNAAHIARCDPTTIAELATRLLSAEARVKVLEDALRRIANTTEGDADLDEYGSAEVARAALQEQER